MEMNDMRVDQSHVAQKNRRHKLRFQQNSGDLNHHHHHQQQHQQQEQQEEEQEQEIHRPLPYNPNVLPSEMLTSIPRNPQLLQHPHGFVQSHDTYGNINLPYPDQDYSNWNNSNHHNAVSYSNSGYAFSSSPFYTTNSTLQQDHVTLALPSQNKSYSWMNMNSSDEAIYLANRIHDNREQTTVVVKEGNFNNCNTQGLSLSLSSASKDDQQPVLRSGQNPAKSDLLPKPFMGVAAFGHRSTGAGPLGPFTGYATILRNSKYIKPAQELLNRSCEVGYQEMGQTCHDGNYSHKFLEEEISKAVDCTVGTYGGSDEHGSGRNSSGGESLRPEFHRKKARLLYMQEEVCRRYKQYLQQMQMVISSFETVAGLSAATPYVCLALKAVSRHFHYVKDVISEQLSQMRKMVGEGLCSSNNTSKGFDGNATSSSRSKSGGGGAGFFAPQQPVWRPQRGLPERAIAVLKTWLFDHFLHPYPSDADKHMLATQTGLTRNQVSNWFINARVRIWKPMVEEIHTLETKGLAEQNSSHPQPDGQDPSWPMDMSSSLSNAQPPECSRNPGVSSTGDEPHNQVQDHDKQARPEYQIPLSSMGLMGIMPYPRATFDATTGLGPVSLTLGLRQNGEHVQQLQQHYGGQLIHDFVG